MKNSTEIVCVIDKSGSMEPRTNDAIGGFNSFLLKQQALPDEAYLTLILFDTDYKVINESTPIKNVQRMDTSIYKPSGCTALLDAVGKSIDSLGIRLDKLAEEQKPSKILIIILTDGEENSSRTFTKQQIKDKIDLQRNSYNWEFIYLGANQDAFAEAVSIGIPKVNAFNVNLSTSAGIDQTYSFMSSSARNYRKSGSIK